MDGRFAEASDHFGQLAELIERIGRPLTAAPPSDISH
jgi:hypothetical protein